MSSSSKFQYLCCSRNGFWELVWFISMECVLVSFACLVVVVVVVVVENCTFYKTVTLSSLHRLGVSQGLLMLRWTCCKPRDQSGVQV